MRTIGGHLVERGHRVIMLTGSRFAAQVAAAGMEPRSLPAGADFDDRVPETFLPDRARYRGLARVRYDIETIFVATIPAQHRAVTEIIDSEHPAALLVDSAFAGIAPLLVGPRSARPPILAAGVIPLVQSSRDVAPYGMGWQPSSTRLGHIRNRTLNLVTQRVLFRPTQQMANRMLAQVGSPPSPVFILDGAAFFDCFLQLTAAEFEYPRSDLAANTRFVGAVLPPMATGWSPPEWWNELDGARPVLHVTQGTMDNQDFSRLIEPTIKAVRDTDALVVVSTGGRPTAELGPLPGNVRAAEFIPYDQLLPHLDIMVTNGGYGGVQYALTHGVPLIAAGDTEDKPEVLGRIAWAGVGVALKTGTPTATQIAQAITTINDDGGFRRRAQALARHFARYRALDVIESELARAAENNH
jgi:MGT family glycosyltransferase